jgi:hypothetical protein
MRALRGIAAGVVWLLATVLLLLSAVLCITVILLPLGIPLGLVAMRLYVYGVQLLAPRPREIKRKVRGKLGLRRRGSVPDDVKRAGKQAGKRARGSADDLGKRGHKVKDDLGKRGRKVKRSARKQSKRLKKRVDR